MNSNNNIRFSINPNKIAPYDTLGVGDWVVFDVFEEDCKIGKISEFENADGNSSEILAVITTPNGLTVKRAVFLEMGHTVYKIDSYIIENIKIIKED